MPAARLRGLHGRVPLPPRGDLRRKARAIVALEKAGCCEGSGRLDRARSRLYRNEILQAKMRLKALAEIYTMHSFAQLCNLNFLSVFLPKKLLHFAKFSKFSKFLKKSQSFGKIPAEFKGDFRAVQRSALCRSRRELSNAYLLAKFRFDTAENEPCKVCRIPRSVSQQSATQPP